MVKWLLLLLLFACGPSGPIVFGPDSPDINIAAEETEDYFAAKGLERGWTSHQVIFIKPQAEVDRICQRNVAGCSTTPWKSFISDSVVPIKQIVKHELGHQGFWRLEKHVDAEHSIHLDYWGEEQWK